MRKLIRGFVISLSMALLFSLSAMAADNEALVTRLDGTAQAFTKGAAAGTPLKKGDVLKKDQEVRVGEKSRIEIRFPDGTVMRFSEKSSVNLNDVFYNKQSGSKSVKVGLSVGKLWANVRKLTTSDSNVEVRTSNAVAGVRGTVYRVNVDEDKSAMVKVYDGSVYVANPPREATTPAGALQQPVQVSGPHQVSPPYHEVTMDEWHVIVQSFQQITISPQGVASKPQDFNAQEDAAEDWVKWNQERDKDLAF